MTATRREFLANLSAAAAAVPLVRHGIVRPRRPSAGLRILILGGTGFIGPYQVQYALDRGHTVTLLNRGKTNPSLFPTVEKLIGDRNTELTVLNGREWDVVIDNSAYDPMWVERSAKQLQKAAKQYIYVSTRSVYFDTSRIPMTIDAPLFSLENTKVEPGKPMPYGLQKALGEKAAQKYFGDRTLIVRPGLIIGPGDLTDRFTYWPVRIERGGEVLAPGDGTDPVQIIDARDFCEWMIRLAEKGTMGIYNVVGPRTPRSFAELLHGIKAVTTSECTFTWVDHDFLIKNNVRPYQEMPVWMPARDGKEGFARFDLSREVALGLTFRPLAVTAKDTLDYYHAQPQERQATLRAGLSAEREKEVLAAYKSR